jgi:hypothetical protein
MLRLLPRRSSRFEPGGASLKMKIKVDRRSAEPIVTNLEDRQTESDVVKRKSI